MFELGMLSFHGVVLLLILLLTAGVIGASCFSISEHAR